MLLSQIHEAKAVVPKGRHCSACKKLAHRRVTSPHSFQQRPLCDLHSWLRHDPGCQLCAAAADCTLQYAASIPFTALLAQPLQRLQGPSLCSAVAGSTVPGAALGSQEL
eukprot:11767-Heterococcus_DN1.PRE.1